MMCKTKQYVCPLIEIIPLDSDSAFLAGSVIDKSISITDTGITVDEFIDAQSGFNDVGSSKREIGF